MMLRILPLALLVTGCYDPVYGAPKDSDTSSADSSGTDGVLDEVTFVMYEGHFQVYVEGIFSDHWAYSSEAAETVSGDYITVNVMPNSGSLTADYDYNGYLVEVDCTTYDYCSAGAEDTFYLSRYPQ